MTSLILIIYFVGENEICVSGISDKVVQDSIRVNGGQAKSQSVVILEVFYSYFLSLIEINSTRLMFFRLFLEKTF